MTMFVHLLGLIFLCSYTFCSTHIYQATMSGNLHLVKRCLDSDPSDIYRKDTHENSLLYTACKEGHLDIVDDFLSRFETHDQALDSKHSALHIAAWQGYNAIVELWLRYYPEDLLYTNDSGITVFYYAAQRRNWSLLESLVKKAIEIGTSVEKLDGENNMGITPSTFFEGGREALECFFEKQAKEFRRSKCLKSSASKR